MVVHSVAVVGGGIAGLTLAAALDPARFDVTILEAQPERTTGAALGLWVDARRMLDEIGVDIAAFADGPSGDGYGVSRTRGGPREPARVALHTMSGRRLLCVPAPPVVQVRRAELMTALRQRAPHVVSHRVNDPRDLDADLVVGADGVRSRVRGVVDPQRARRRPTRWMTLRGIAPHVGDLDEHDALAREFWGGGRLFGDAPVRGGRYWFTAHATPPPAASSSVGASSAGAGSSSRPVVPDPLGAPEPSETLDVAAVLDEARRRFADAAPLVRDALAAADEATLATRLWVAPPMRRYVRGRYVVIGDAAHAALPNLARGASDAIVDAVTLARTLEEGGSVQAWQRRRLPATQATRLGAAAVMGVATGLGRFPGSPH